MIFFVAYVHSCPQTNSLAVRNKTRMKTSISSEALYQLGTEKITFPPKPDIQTDILTDGHKPI